MIGFETRASNPALIFLFTHSIIFLGNSSKMQLRKIRHTLFSKAPLILFLLLLLFATVNFLSVSTERESDRRPVPLPPWEEKRLLRRFWDLVKENGTNTASFFHAQELKDLWSPFKKLRSESGVTRWLPQVVWGMEAKLQGLDQKPKKTILVWSSEDWWWLPMWKETMPVSKIRCESDFTESLLLTNCDFIRDRRRIREVDAVLTSWAGLERMKDLPDTTLRFLYNLEPPVKFVGITRREMDLLVTYWRGSDVVTPYGYWAYKDPNIKGLEPGRNYSRGKNKPVAAFISNCNAKNGRQRYISELKKHIEVHVYGGCGDRNCTLWSEACYDILKRDYYFYLAFENSNCRDYISEKFYLNGLANDLVPIVMGAHPNDYKDLAPTHSYIHVEDYESPEALSKELKRLIATPSAYNEYFAWKGAVKLKRVEIQKTPFCQICAMVHYADIVPPPKRKVPFRWEESGGMCLPRGQWYWGRPN